MRRLLAAIMFSLALTGVAAAASPPSISQISTPYLPVQAPVHYGGAVYGPGAVSYGPVGTPVVISGFNFGSSGTVAFRSTTTGQTVNAATSFWSNTSISALVPSGAGTGKVVVTAGGQNSNGVVFMVTGLTSGTTYGSSCPAGRSSSQLTILTNVLPSAVVNTVYSTSLQVTGGTAPYTWSISSGALPTGIQISSSGFLNGTSTATGSSVFAVQVHDASNNFAGATFTIEITAGPVITGLSLPQGPPQMGFVISGSNFGLFQGNSSVAINPAPPFQSIPLTVVSWDIGKIVVQLPANAPTNVRGSVVVNESGASSNTDQQFTVIPAVTCK